jgi:hypothetical protein
LSNSDIVTAIASFAALLQFLALVITIFVLMRTAKRQLRAYLSIERLEGMESINTVRQNLRLRSRSKTAVKLRHMTAQYGIVFMHFLKILPFQHWRE